MSAITAAHEIDEAREIRNRAIAWEAYAKQATNFEAERMAAEIRIRAERRCGEMLAEDEKAKGRAGPGRGKAGGIERPAFNDAPTLAERGITKDQSSDWQKLAKIPQQEFDRIVADSAPARTHNVLARAGIPRAASHKAAKGLLSTGDYWIFNCEAVCKEYEIADSVFALGTWRDATLPQRHEMLEMAKRSHHQPNKRPRITSGIVDSV